MIVTKYLHACDASAAAGISGSTLFAAASDEDSVLRVYDRAAAGAPLSVLDAATFLDLDEPAKPETDIEGAAQLSVGGVLDLEGRGIRALEFVAALDRYLVLAGAFNDAQQFRLYEWAGRPDAPARPLIDHITDLKPEELIVVDATDREITLQLLSDDGTDVCKEAPIAQRSFRGRTMKLQL